MDSPQREKVVCVVRQSQGTDDSLSLEEQRETTHELAEDLGDPDPEFVDLGNHTGFSIFVKTPEQARLDANPRIQALETDLRNGEYDYLVAHEDSRVARDQFYWVLAYAAEVGGIEIEYVADVPDDQLTFRVQRAVEAEVKRKEIEKARRAKQRRRDAGMYEGAPPFGLQYDDAGEYLVRDPDEWPQVVRIFELLDEGDATYTDILADDEVTDVGSAGTITKIRDRRETYEEFADGGL